MVNMPARWVTTPISMVTNQFPSGATHASSYWSRSLVTGQLKSFKLPSLALFATVCAMTWAARILLDDFGSF